MRDGCSIESWMEVTREFINANYDDDNIDVYSRLLDIAMAYPHLNPVDYHKYMSKRGVRVYDQLIATYDLQEDCSALHLLIYFVNNEALFLRYESIIDEVKRINNIK